MTVDENGRYDILTENNVTMSLTSTDITDTINKAQKSGEKYIVLENQENQLVGKGKHPKPKVLSYRPGRHPTETFLNRWRKPNLLKEVSPMVTEEISCKLTRLARTL